MTSKQDEKMTTEQKESSDKSRIPTDIEPIIIKATYLFATDGKPLISVRWVDSGTPEDQVIGSFVAAIINFGGKRSENKPRNIMLKNAKFVFLKRANYIAVATGNKYAKTDITERFLEKAIPSNEDKLDRKAVLEHFISAVMTIVGLENMRHIGVGDDLNSDEIQMVYNQIQTALEHQQKNTEQEQVNPIVSSFPNVNITQEGEFEEIKEDLFDKMDDYLEKKRIAKEYLETFCEEEAGIKNLILIFPSEYEGIDVIVAGEKESQIANRVTEVITADLTTPILICNRAFEERILEIQNHFILLQGIKETDAFIIGIVGNPRGKEK